MNVTVPPELVVGAVVVSGTELAAVTRDDVVNAERLVVTDGESPPEAARTAAERLGVDVVARVDRAGLGNGRRKGHQWMTFPANGGRPRPAAVVPAAIVTPATTTPPVAGKGWAAQPKLSDEVFASRYPLLSRVNPFYRRGGDFATNCVLAAKFTDSTLEEGWNERDEDPGLRPFYQVPPMRRAGRRYLHDLVEGTPVEVPGYQAIVDAMRTAGPGSRGLVVVGVPGAENGHIFNVVHDENGVVFLDGQKGEQAVLPENFESLEFLPTSASFPHHAIATAPAPARRPRFLAGGDENNQEANFKSWLHDLVRAQESPKVNVPAPRRDPLRLSDLAEEKHWWRVFLDPNDHARAQDASPDDPGSLYDNEISPGYRAGMVEGYRKYLDTTDHPRMTWDIYHEMHRMITGHAQGDFTLSGGPGEPDTFFYLGASEASSDVLFETIGGRWLMADTTSGPSTVDSITRLVKEENGHLSIKAIGSSQDVPVVVENVFKAFYQDIEHARSDFSRLRAISRVVRNLHIVHPFSDGNGRLNIYLLLPRLLLEHGFKPAVLPSMAHLFSGGYSLDQMAAALSWGQGHDLRDEFIPPVFIGEEDTGTPAGAVFDEEAERWKAEQEKLWSVPADDDLVAVLDPQGQPTRPAVPPHVSRTPSPEPAPMTTHPPAAADPTPPARRPGAPAAAHRRDVRPRHFGSQAEPAPNALENSVRERLNVRRDGKEDVLGIDAFGVRAAPPAPAFLTGYRYSDLHADRRAAFLESIDLTRAGTPAPAALRPDRLATGPVSEGRQVSRNHGLLGGKAQKVPHISHSIWFGGPLHDDGGDRAAFMANITAAAQANPAFTFAVWTDVTRAEFDAVRTDEPVDGRGRQVREMLRWAERNGVRLVNVDEVFDAGHPMTMDGPVRVERGRGNPTGLAAGSDLARVEILRRFGGVYSDGDNVIGADLWRAAASAAASEEGLAVGRERLGKTTNALLAAAAGSVGIRRYHEVLQENYATRLSHAMYQMLTPDLDVRDPSVFPPATLADMDQLNAVQNGATGSTAARETLARTGPNGRTFDEVARRLGHEDRHTLTVVPPGIVTIESAHSWLAPGHGDQTPADTATLTRAVVGAVTALHRELRSRPGGLYLPAAARTIGRLPESQREEVWEVTLQTFRDTLPAGTPVDWISGHNVDVTTGVNDLIDTLFPGVTKVRFDVTAVDAQGQAPAHLGGVSGRPGRGWAGHRRLDAATVRASYPWLTKINPLHALGEDPATNCLLAAIGTDLTLEEAAKDPGEDPALRAYYAVPSSERAERAQLANMGTGEPIDVSGYAAIVDAMTVAGRGARGIVIVGVEGEENGHIVNVVHDENGVVFLDGQKGRQAFLPARFQSLEFLPTSANFPREAITAATVPGAHQSFLGAYGLEFETPLVIRELPEDLKGSSGFTLATNERLGYKVKLDSRTFYRDTDGVYHPTKWHFENSGKTLDEEVYEGIVEFVSLPFGATGQPLDARLNDRATAIDSIRGKLDTLREAAAGHPDNRPRIALRDLFPTGDDWVLDDATAGTTIELLPVMVPGTDDTALYAQYTAGVPLTEMHAFLRDALVNGPNRGRAPQNVPERVLEEGIELGDEIAARFVAWHYGVNVPSSAIDILADIESVSAIRGFVALMYPHIATSIQAYIDPFQLVKNRLRVASRVALGGVRQELPDEARRFLERSAPDIRIALEAKFRSGQPNYETDYYQVAKNNRDYYRVAKRKGGGLIDLLGLPLVDNEGLTVGDYLDNALFETPGTRISQNQAMGIFTDFETADTNDGTLTVPLVVVEVRARGPFPVGVDEADGILDTIDRMLGPAYDQAQRRRAGLPKDEIDRLLATARTRRALPTPPSRQGRPAGLAGPRPAGLTGPRRPGEGPRFIAGTPDTGTESEWQGHTRRPDDVFARRYPLVSRVNQNYELGDDFATNCVLAAKYTDSTLMEDWREQHVEPGRRVYYQVPPMERVERTYLRELVGGTPVDVPGYQTIVDAMKAAGPGSRGMVIIGRHGEETGHIVNVVHDEDGVVFIDGQKGEQAVLPEHFESLEFLPTSANFPRHAITHATTPGPHTRFLGGKGDRTTPEQAGEALKTWTWHTASRGGVNYDVSETGWLHLRTGDGHHVMLSPDGWVRRGADFVHPDRFAVLDGTTGVVHLAPGEDWNAIEADVQDGTLLPYHARADETGLYFTPSDEGQQVRLPLSDDPTLLEPKPAAAPPPRGFRFPFRDTARSTGVRMPGRSAQDGGARSRWSSSKLPGSRLWTAKQQGDGAPAREALPSMPVEEFLDGVQVSVVDGRVVGIWLPGAKDAEDFDEETFRWLDPPAGAVFVFGEVRNGRVVVGGREVSETALASAIAGRAPGLAPILWMANSTQIARGLAERLGEPVLAAPHDLRVDRDNGTLISDGPTDGRSEDKPHDEWFRVYVPGDGDGRPFSPELPVGRRKDDATPAEDPPEDDDSPATPTPTDPMVRSIGVPRAGLPSVPQLIRLIKRMIPPGVQIPKDVYDALPQRLLSNYPYLLESAEKDGVSGLMVPLGPVELLISLDPDDPHTVKNTAGSTTAPSTVKSEGEHRATGGLNAVYATGAKADSHSGKTGQTHLPVSLSFGAGITPAAFQFVRTALSFNFVANAHSRGTTHIADAEGGHVEDNRIDSTLLSYTPNWSVKLRTDPRAKWENIKARRPKDRGKEKLLLWVPKHYEKKAPEQVVAGGEGVQSERLPDSFFASGLTGLPQLFDQIAGQLQAQGVKLPIGGYTRAALLQKLWNLNMHLDEAVNDKKRGYSFVLENKRGKKIATVDLHAERVPFGAPRVGETSDKSHVENVRTAIDGLSGSHTVGQSTTVTGSIEFDVMPNPLIADLGLGVSPYVSATWSNSDAISAGRNGLWVVVPRYAGHTAGYRAQFSYTADVRVRGHEGGAKGTTEPVVGTALLRLSEPDAFEHGFPVDKAALKEHPGDRRQVRFTPDAVRNTGPREGDPAPGTKEPPEHLKEGKGIGMGLVRVSQETVDRMKAELEPILRARGFLPPEGDTFGGRHWWQHGDDLDSQIDNQQTLDKMISVRGLDSHYDTIRQDGLPITFRRRRGFAGMTLDVDSAKIVIKAKETKGKPPSFLRSTGEYHTVNLAMGMDTAGQSTSGSKKIAVGLKFKIFFKWLKAGLTGVELQKTVGATDAVNFLNNRPELLEYPGVVDEFELTSDYEIKVQFEHSGVQGDLRPDVRNPPKIKIPEQKAVAHLVPLVNVPDAKPPRPKGARINRTPGRVLDQAVIYHLDTTGLLKKATNTFRRLTGAAGKADQELSSVASTIQLRAHLKEIINGEYTTDQPFDPGFFRDTLVGLNISGQMRESDFAGATKDKFVLGVIKLWLAQASSTDSASKGVTWDQLDLAVGGEAGHSGLTGEVDANKHWQWNKSKTKTHTGGTELIQLDFNRAYAYKTLVDFEVKGRREKWGKFFRTAWKVGGGRVRKRSMIYMLPEPEALARYAEGVLPVSDVQLADAMARWQLGEQERPPGSEPEPLVLSGDTVARILTRWAQESPTLPAMPKEVDDITGLAFNRERLVDLLIQLHTEDRMPIVDRKVREAFGRQFKVDLPERGNPYRNMELPEYLTREDPGGKMLGHHGVYDLRFDNGKSMYQIVKEQVDKVAPGLLAMNPEVWDGKGRKLGRLQGGIDSLQSILARGRDQAMIEDLRDLELNFINTSGWFGADSVKIKLNDVLISAPEIHEFKPSTGMENYDHQYLTTSETKSRDVSQAFMLAKLSIGRGAVPGDSTDNPPPSGSAQPALKTSEGTHRSTTRSENAVVEQTVYDWGGHYRVGFRHELSVSVERLDMTGRPVNNWFMRLFDYWTHHSATSSTIVRGDLELEVPKAIAEAGVSRGPEGPRHFVPLPKLPGNSWIAGTLLGDALKSARALLNRVFGRDADNVRTARSTLSLPVRFAPTHMRNNVRDMAGGGRFKLAEGLFIPGHSSDRATLWMSGDLYDLQVIAPVKEGTGPGRYIKHQSGTTGGSSSDHWRATTEVGGDAGGTIKPHNPPHSADGSTSVSHTTGAGQGSAGTENYRREGHVKEQGPVYMVRMRGRFRIEADKWSHRLFGKPKQGAHFEGDPVTGDVYAVLYQSQVDELREQLRAETEKARAKAANWPAMYGVSTFPLRPRLAEAAENKLGAFRAYQGVARHVREQIGGDRPFVLTFDETEVDNERLRLMLRWATRTLRADYRAVREADATAEPPASLRRYQELLDKGESPDPTADTDTVITGIIRQVNRYHSMRPDNPLGPPKSMPPDDLPPGHPDEPKGPPAELPPEIAVYGMDLVYLARDVSHELGAHIRLDITKRDLTVEHHWTDPEGRVYAFDPHTFDDTKLSAARAQRAGLLPERLRDDVDGLGIDDADLGRVYRDSWAHQRTFEQELLRLIGERRARLASLHPGLPDLFDQARESEAFWHDEVRTLDAAAKRLPDGSEERQAVERRLASARDNHRDVTQALDDLRAAAREPAEEQPAADAAKTADTAPATDATVWDDEAVTSLGDRLGDLESAAGEATGEHTAGAFRHWTAAEGAEAVGRLERTVRQQGSGAVSIVVVGEDDTYTVANLGGEVTWFDSMSGSEVDRPADLGVEGASLELGPTGEPLTPQPSANPSAFRRLRSRALGVVEHRRASETAEERPERPSGHTEPQPGVGEVVVDRPLPHDARLYVNDQGGHRIGPSGLNRDTWRELGALSTYAPLSWLVQGAPARGFGLTNVAESDGNGAVRFLTHLRTPLEQGSISVADAVQTFMEDLPERTVEHVEALPENLPPDTWIWFRSSTRSGAAIVLGDGTLRIWMPGHGGTLTSGRAGSAMMGGATFVIARPAATRPSDETVISPSLLSGSRSSGFTPGQGLPGDAALAALARSGPHLYEDGDGTPWIGPPGAGGGRTDVGPLREYAPIHWLVTGRPSGGVTVEELMRGNLDALTRYLKSEGTDRERVRRFMTDSGRDVETTRTLPVDLPSGTWIWFTSRTGFTGAAVVRPGGRYELFSPDVRDTANRTDADVRHMLGQADYTLVIGRSPVVSTPSSQGTKTPSSSGRFGSLRGFAWYRSGTSTPASRSTSKSGSAGSSKSAGRRKAASREDYAVTDDRRAMAAERRRYNEAEVAAKVKRLKLKAVDVPPDGNCFYSSLMVIAAPELMRRVPLLSGALRNGRNAAVRVFRNWLADRVEADLASATSRYAPFIHTPDGQFVEDRHSEVVNQIREFGLWDSQTGDIVVEIAAMELGLPLTVIQSGADLDLGPDGAHRIHFIRRPGHFLGARRTDGNAGPQAWERLTPNPGETGQEDVSALIDRFGDARARLQRVLDGLPKTRREHFATLAETEQVRVQNEMEAETYLGVPEGLREPLRNAAIRGAVSAVGDLIRLAEGDTERRDAAAEGFVLDTGEFWDVVDRLPEGQRPPFAERFETTRKVVEQARLTAATETIAGAHQDFRAMIREAREALAPAQPPPIELESREGPSDYLVSQVNTELRSLGDRYTHGRVDADRIQDAIDELSAAHTDARGRADEIAHQIAFGKPMRRRGGGIGLEVETRFGVYGLDMTGVTTATLISTPQFSLVTDYGTATVGPDAGKSVPIVELVLRPAAALDGERGRMSQEQAFEIVSYVVERLRKARRGATIAEVFRGLSGATVYPKAHSARLRGEVNPGMLYVQYTAGVPMAGVRDFLQLSGRNDASPASRHLTSALTFGDTVAARFAGLDPNDPGVREQLRWLTARDAEIAIVQSYATLVYTQVAAALQPSITGNGTYAKNHTVVASRNPLAALRESLPPMVRRFLERSADGIGADFQARFRADNREVLREAGYADDENLLQVEWEDTVGREVRRRSVGQYLDNALVHLPDHKLIDQYDALSVATQVPALDDNFGNRPELPLVVLEARVYGDVVYRSVDRVRADYDRLSESVRDLDREARRLMSPEDGPGVEVRFGKRNKTVDAGQRNTVAAFAAYVGLTAVRRDRDRGPALVVRVDGGGNGGVFSDAGDVGTERAEAVEAEVRPLVEAFLRRNRVPLSMVRWESTSRGDGGQRGYPFAQAPGEQDEQQRRVLMWVAAPPARRRRTERTAPSAPAGEPRVSRQRTAADLMPHVVSAIDRIVVPGLYRPHAHEVLAAYESLPPTMRRDPLPGLGRRIAEMILDPGHEPSRMPGAGRVVPQQAAAGSSTGPGTAAGDALRESAGLDERYGPALPPHRDEPYEGASPYRLSDLPPDFLTGRRGTVLHYAVDEQGEIRLTEDERSLTAPARVAGQVRWSAERGRWEVDGSSRRFMGEAVRPGVERPVAEHWVTSVTEDLAGHFGTEFTPVAAGTSRTLSDMVYQALSGPAPVKYSAEDTFDAEYEATVEEFPEVGAPEGWSMRGQGSDVPEGRVFVAENTALGGLRGQYDTAAPKAGRVADSSGRLYSEGPAWNWYLPGRNGVVASSRPITDARRGVEGAPAGLARRHRVRDTPPVEPSSVAALPRMLDGGLPHTVRWRSEADTAPLYKFSERPPEEVFAQGLRPKGDHLGHLVEHVYRNPANTGWLSTSRNYHYLRDSVLNDPGSAAPLHNRYRWRYDVQVPGGIDVNATLDLASPFPDQEEVVFPGGIDVRFIRGVQPLVNGSPWGPYIVNPAYAPAVGV